VTLSSKEFEARLLTRKFTAPGNTSGSSQSSQSENFLVHAESIYLRSITSFEQLLNAKMTVGLSKDELFNNCNQMKLKIQKELNSKHGSLKRDLTMSIREITEESRIRKEIVRLNAKYLAMIDFMINNKLKDLGLKPDD
jgi:hypothetical protein